MQQGTLVNEYAKTLYGNDYTYFEHKINWTDCPITGEPISFFLYESGEYY